MLFYLHTDIEWLRLEGMYRAQLVQHLPTQVVLSSRFPIAISRQLWNISKDGGYINPLENI